MARPYQPLRDRFRSRIDARPQNSAATQAGMRGVHRDTRGNVIGGYTAEGQGIGTKSGNWRSPMTDIGGMPPAVALAQPVTTMATPASTVNPNATPAAPKRSWRDGGVPGTIGQEIGTQPNQNGGGLWRWHAMNPTAGKFGQKGEVPTNAGTATAKLEPAPTPKTPWRRRAVA